MNQSLTRSSPKPTLPRPRAPRHRGERRARRRRPRREPGSRPGRAPGALRVDAAPPPDPDLGALSAALQSDARDSSVYFRVLCTTLEDALPKNTTVEREHSVFKTKRVARKVTVNLAHETFEAEESAGRLLCRHIHSVQGVGGGLPYAKELSMEEWLDALLASVAQDAGANSAAASALRSLTT